MRRIWTDPVWSKIIATVLTALLTCAVSISAVIVSKAYEISPVLSIALSISVMILSSFFFYKIYIRRKIHFNFEDCVFLVEDETTGTMVLRLQAIGKNRSKDSIAVIDGYLVSEMTNEKYDVYLRVEEAFLRPNETNGIPPKCTFEIAIPLNHDFSMTNQLSPMPLDFFQRNFKSFSLVINQAGVEIRYRISELQLCKAIARYHRKIRQRGPRITKRNTDRIGSLPAT